MHVGVLGDKEVDFVALKGEKTVYIQVALTVGNKETRAQEFSNLTLLEDNYEKIVVSLDPMVMDYKSIKHFRLDDFFINFR